MADRRPAGGTYHTAWHRDMAFELGDRNDNQRLLGREKGGKTMSQLEELYARLDNLEGCADNPVYASQIKMIRSEISKLNNKTAHGAGNAEGGKEKTS